MSNDYLLVLLLSIKLLTHRSLNVIFTPSRPVSAGTTLDIVARVWKLFLDIYALLKLTKHVYIAILSKASMIPVTM